MTPEANLSAVSLTLVVKDEGIIKTPIPKCRLYWCFCLGWCSNFVGRGEGVGEVREKVAGQRFTRGVENTNMTDCISSL